MDRKEIEEKVNQFLVEEFEVDENALASEARIKQDLGIDSLDVVDIVVEVEKVFGCRLKAEEIKGVAVLSQLYDLIETKVA